jgi:hypothetical protein
VDFPFLLFLFAHIIRFCLFEFFAHDEQLQLNLLWSLLYNCLGIPLAAGMFYPIFHSRLPPTVAAMAMALSSVSVVSSSLALRFYSPPDVLSDPSSLSSSSRDQGRRRRSSSSRRLRSRANDRAGRRSINGISEGSLEEPLLARHPTAETSNLNRLEEGLGTEDD